MCDSAIATRASISKDEQQHRGGFVLVGDQAFDLLIGPEVAPAGYLRGRGWPQEAKHAAGPHLRHSPPGRAPWCCRAVPPSPPLQILSDGPAFGRRVVRVSRRLITASSVNRRTTDGPAFPGVAGGIASAAAPTFALEPAGLARRFIPASAGRRRATRRRISALDGRRGRNASTFIRLAASRGSP